MEKKYLFNEPLENILYECADLMKVVTAQDKIVREFHSFINECLFGELHGRYCDKIDFKNNPNPETLRKWGLLFYDYCFEEYGGD